MNPYSTMTPTVSRDAVAALKPLRLGDGEAKDIKYTDSQIILPNTKGKSEGDEEGKNNADSLQTTIKTEQLVLVASVEDGGYLLVTLNEAQPEETVHFSLSSFFLPTLPDDLVSRYLLTQAPAIIPVAAASSSSSAPDSSLNVIVSTHSGTHLALEFHDAVLQPLLALLGLTSSNESDNGATAQTQRGSYRVIKTENADTIKDFATKRWGSQSEAPSPATSQAKETIILLSGDGGVVDLLNGIRDTSSQRPTIALIPLGTGNALFHSMHKPHYSSASSSISLEDASPPPSPLTLSLRALLKGCSAPLPSFTASFSPGAHLVHGAETNPQDMTHLVGAIVASYGFHAQLVWESDTPAYRKFGAQRFGMVAQELLKDLHKYDASLTISNKKSQQQQQEGRVAVGASDSATPLLNYALLTLVSNLEKTFTISPASKPLDGTLRLVYFEGKTGEEAGSVMMGAYDGGKHVGAPGLQYLEASSAGGGNEGGVVELVTREKDPRWRKVCIDGTIVELPEGGTMKVATNEVPRLDVIFLGA